LKLDFVGLLKGLWNTAKTESKPKNPMFENLVNSFTSQLFSIENWNRWFEEKRSAINEIPKLAWAHIENSFSITKVAFSTISSTIGNIGSQARSWLDVNILAPVLNAWETFKSGLIENPTLKAFGEFLKDPLGYIWNSIFQTANADTGDGPKTATVSIMVDTRTADQAIVDVSRNITNLTQILPQINLQNNQAFKVLSATAKGIMNLEDLKPQIQLKNREAFDVIAATAKEIMQLEDLEPNIKVKFSGSGTISGAASGSIRIARQGMNEILGQDTTIYAHAGEHVKITPAQQTKENLLGSSNNTIHIHQHLLNREIVQTLNIEKGRMVSKHGPS
jgi:hypothetical protein